MHGERSRQDPAQDQWGLDGRGSTTTDASGFYKNKIKDKPGKYRAKAPKVTLNAGADICSAATSLVRKNT